MALLTTGSFKFDPARSTEILLDKRKYSFVQALAKRVNMTLGGAYVTIFDTETSGGGFVNQEGGKKPVGEQTVSSASVALHEWAVIIPVSNRIAKANPDGVLSLIEEGAYQLLARDFDKLATAGVVGLGTSVADSLASVTKTAPLQTASGVGTSGTWTGLNNGLKLLADDGKQWTASIWDSRIEPVLNLDVDANNRPIYMDAAAPLTDRLANRPGLVLGRPSDLAVGVNPDLGALDAADLVGYAGDWSRAVWGTIGDISYSVSTEASWDDGTGYKSAFQHNVTLFRVETLLGFKVLDPDAFVKFTLGSPGGGGDA